LEIHLTEGSISLAGDQFNEMPADVFALSAGRTVGGVALAEGRNDGLLPPEPPDRFTTVSLGVEHFLACVAGTERPILTAEHARHTLEVVLAAYESIADGGSKDLRTTFQRTGTEQPSGSQA
jgi:predicted dehydrogenase